MLELGVLASEECVVFIDMGTPEDYARAQEFSNRLDELNCRKQPSSISDWESGSMGDGVLSFRSTKRHMRGLQAVSEVMPTTCSCRRPASWDELSGVGASLRRMDEANE